MPDVVMPRLSDSMEEGTILKWLKAEGDQIDALLRPVLDGEPRDFEWVGRLSGIHLSVQAVAVRDVRAGVIGVMAVCRDVTPRHEVDAALRSSRGLPTGAPARAR